MLGFAPVHMYSPVLLFGSALALLSALADQQTRAEITPSASDFPVVTAPGAGTYQ